MANSANISIEPLQPEQADEFVFVQYAAFASPEADMILPMVYPAGWRPDLQLRLRQRLLNTINQSPSGACFCAKDTVSGEIVGIAWWNTSLDPPQSRAEIDDLYAKAVAARADLPPVEGMNEPLNEAFFKTSFYTMHELAGGKPHVELVILATHPKHHRKGVASLLLSQGLEQADRLKLPAILTSGWNGKPLYERFGFEEVYDFPFDARKYGGRSEAKHWCMIRPAKA